MEIHPLHPVADTCQNLIRDSVEGIGEYCYWEIISKYFYAITFLTWDVGHVNHTNIHADVTYIFRLLAVYETIAMAIAEMAVETIGIAYRNSGNHAVLLKNCPTAISNTFSCRNMANLENCGLQCADIRENLVVSWINAIETKTKAAHIHLTLWEMLYACRVADMTQNLMLKGGL